MGRYLSSYTGTQIDKSVADSLAVETKTSAMSQPVGKDASGKLWAEGVTSANIQSALGYVPVSPTQLNGKLNVSQGVTHAGKFMVVGMDGNIVPQAFSVLEGGSY